MSGAAPRLGAGLSNAPVGEPATPTRRPRRGLWGLRGTPGRLALAVFRLPLHGARVGRLPRTFLTFTHRGRVTGDLHETVAMVLQHDDATGELVICAAWGPTCDWVRNLRAAPATSVRFGTTSFTPWQRFLDEDEAVRVLLTFQDRHRQRGRLLRSVLGWGDLRGDAGARAFVRGHPFVAFRPAAGSS